MNLSPVNRVDHILRDIDPKTFDQVISNNDSNYMYLVAEAQQIKEERKGAEDSSVLRQGKTGAELADVGEDVAVGEGDA